MPWLEPVTLSGLHAKLEPLSRDHCDGLIGAVHDGELSKLWYTAIPAPENMAAEIERRLGLQEAGAMLPFTVRDAVGKIAGMTTYMNADAANRRVEIGSTWYGKWVQRTALNTQCKLLLLTYAFKRSTVSRWNSARTSSITSLAARSNVLAQSRTVSCAIRRLAPTARYAIPSFIASFRMNGRR